MFQVRSSSVVKECLWGQLLHSNVLQTIWDFSQSTNYDRDICFLISTQIWYSILDFWCLSNFSCSLKIMFWFPIIATFMFLFFLLIQTMSGFLASITSSTLLLKDIWSLYSSFSSAASAIYSHRFLWHSKLYFLKIKLMKLFCYFFMSFLILISC